MFGSLDVSTSGLVAQRTRMDTIATNIANAQTTGDAAGRANPYRRRFVVFATGDERGGPGVRVTAVREDPAPFPLRWDPNHPHRIREGPDAGYVRMPNVDYSTEMVNAIEASRAYEANITAMNVTKQMISATFKLLA